MSPTYHYPRAGIDYYDPATFAGAIRCADCLIDQGATAELLASLRIVYEAGGQIARANARRQPAGTYAWNDCDECDTCARPVCRGLVCGACGFAPGCDEHDEGHHATCPERPEIIEPELRPACDCDQSGSGYALCSHCYAEQVGGES
jgi:hypothetical protein